MNREVTLYMKFTKIKILQKKSIMESLWAGIPDCNSKKYSSRTVLPALRSGQ